ncbi:MAG TPA: hypothetical protein VLT33_52030 [Labilithrix sp.]|nr:hypothetical protein [Labilithrix sp.]
MTETALRGWVGAVLVFMGGVASACAETPEPRVPVRPAPYVAPKHLPGPMEGVWATRMGAALAEAGLDVHALPPLEQLSAGQKQRVMRTFTESLGIPCLGCHSEESFAADTRRKRVAKRMYNEIVRALALRDGEPVYCDSCHDGDLFMLDRRDTSRLTRHMSQVMVGQLTRVDGRPHDCTSCHGDPPDFTMLTTWKGSAAPDMVLEGKTAPGEILAPHRPAVGARTPDDCGPSSEACPLQRLMRDEVANAVVGGDGAALAATLERVAQATPDATWAWSTIARAGAAAARAGDRPGTRKACAQCHELYKAQWRASHRRRAVP